jgi:hypothetical protein
VKMLSSCPACTARTTALQTYSCPSFGVAHLHVHPGGVEAGAQRHDLPQAAAALCRLHELCYDAPQCCCPGVVACIASASGLIGTMHHPSLHDAQSSFCTVAVVLHNIYKWGGHTSVDQWRSTLWAPYKVTHEVILKVPQFHA